MGMLDWPADVLQPPRERAHQTVVVRFPTALLVAKNAACKPIGRAHSNILHFERGKRKPELESFAWNMTPKEKTGLNAEIAETKSAESTERIERVRHRTLAMSGCVEGAERLWHIAYRGPERRTPWSSHSFSYLG